MSRLNNFGEPWRCTIVKDRYNGCYSGAEWIAFDVDVPDEVGDGDVEEMNFYNTDQHKKYVIGKGQTPTEAYENLITRLKGLI